LFPGIPLSTPGVYGALKPPDRPPAGDPTIGGPAIGENHLTPAALTVSEPFREAYAALRREFAGGGCFFMSGSGSTLVWLTLDKELNPAQQAILRRFDCRSRLFGFH
jgi:4-diphosphocytidyl-2C-methyl-D-erythritol kinase